MNRRAVQLKTLPVLAGILVVAATVALSAASAKSREPAGPPPDAVLTWNTNAVNAVRASTPTKVQTDGMVYMSYVQAAVYDAVTKLEGRYLPYHDFTVAVVPGASVQAAVAAAARTTLDHYLPDQQATVDAEYSAYLATLSGDVGDGVAVGRGGGERHHRVPQRRRSQRGDAELRADRADPARTVAATAESGGADAVAGDDAAVPARAGLAVPGRAAARADEPPVREGPERDRGLRCAQQQRPHAGADQAIAYFWVGNNINQYNQTMQNVVAQHGMDLVDAAHLLAMGEIVTTDAGIACFDSKFFYQFWRPITAIRNADKDGNPDTTADPAWQALLVVPGHPEYPSQHGCFTAAFSDTLAAALHTQAPRRHDAGRTERQQPSSPPASTSTPSKTSRTRSSTPESGSASTSATPSSKARNSATTSPTGSSSSSSSPVSGNRSSIHAIGPPPGAGQSRFRERPWSVVADVARRATRAHDAQEDVRAGPSGTSAASILRPAVERRSPRLEQPSRHELPQAARAPVAQWIEQWFPKPRAQVRFLPGASREIARFPGLFIGRAQFELSGLIRRSSALDCPILSHEPSRGWYFRSRGTVHGHHGQAPECRSRTAAVQRRPRSAEGAIRRGALSGRGRRRSRRDTCSSTTSSETSTLESRRASWPWT